MEKTYNIAVIPGDGTGPEVVAESVKILKTAAELFGFGLNLKYFDFGGEKYLRTGETLPDGAIEELGNKNDRIDGINAILLGAIGHPKVKPGILEKGILLKLRFELDQYINLRPVKLYPGVDCPLKGKGPDEIDFVVIRENVEGAYTGSGGFLKKGTPDEVAIQTSINTFKGVERCIRFAFEECRNRHRRTSGWKGLSEDEKKVGKIGKVTLCGKTNVLTFAFDLWERVFKQVAGEYPDIIPEYVNVDALCMFMVKNPENYDVIVTDNMFGDIITDLGAMIQGGMGIAAGGNMNPQGVSMFEPIGGSAPKYAGKNVINPLAAICAGGMMLKHLGENKAGNNIELAVMTATNYHVKNLAAGQMGRSTTEVGDLIVKILLDAVKGGFI